MKSPRPESLWLHEAEAVADSALPDFLVRQRWYPAKDAGRPAAELATLLPFPARRLSAALAIWRVIPLGRVPVYLFVPLALLPASEADPAAIVAASANQPEMVLVEAFSTDDFVRAWIDMMMSGRGDPGGPPFLRAGSTKHVAQARLQRGSDWLIRRSKAEQSNTSIRIGESAILKVIRKLEEGVHPELEVGRFLSDEAGFIATPKTLAWAEIEAVAGLGAATLSVVQTFVPNQGDGWSWVVDQLSQGAADPTIVWLRRLGRRTADMHRTFAFGSNGPAFRPEPAGSADLQSWVAAADAMAQRALDAVAANREKLPSTAHELAKTLLAHRRILLQQLRTGLAGISEFMKTRHHGDYHLGQVLVAGDDAVIIDFEGEPLRPLVERRAKNAALRDVAGMLRSLAYATAAAGKDLSEAARQGLAGWEAQASRAYLNSYLEAAAGANFLPSERAAAERLVRFFMLEKALYEVVYELANRPEWVSIPLRGVLALLSIGSASSPALPPNAVRCRAAARWPDTFPPVGAAARGGQAYSRWSRYPADGCSRRRLARGADE